MKGIIRKIDALGRIVIPKEMRKALKLRNNDPMSIELQGEQIVIARHRDSRLVKLIERACQEVENMSKSGEVYGIIGDFYVYGKENGNAVSTDIMLLGNKSQKQIERLAITPVSIIEEVCYEVETISETPCAIIAPYEMADVVRYVLELTSRIAD